jgi:hypothetical protein
MDGLSTLDFFWRGARVDGSMMVSGAGRFLDDGTDALFSGAFSFVFCFFFGGTIADVEATGRLAKISSISDMVGGEKER